MGCTSTLLRGQHAKRSGWRPMRNRSKRLIGYTVVTVVFFGHLVSNASAAPAGQPASLQRKRQCLEAQIQKWQQEGKDLQPIAEILQDFPPLFEQQKFAEAEQVVDRALKVTGVTCPDQPASPALGAQPSTPTDPP